MANIQLLLETYNNTTADDQIFTIEDKRLTHSGCPSSIVKHHNISIIARLDTNSTFWVSADATNLYRDIITCEQLIFIHHIAMVYI